MVDHRRHLHAHPEVGLELPDTHAYISAALRGLGLEPEVRPGAGVSVRMPGRAGTGQVRILRADMDALPLQERTGLPYASRRPGAMHACGHDLHMSMLLGAARSFVTSPPRHDVVLAFQPGEESDRGALRTLEHESLRVGPTAKAFAIHVNAVVPSGIVTTRAGTFMAHGDWFEVVFSGAGGHASMPDLAGNPIHATAVFVQGLQELVDRLGENEPLVATVTEALAGNTVNVIPVRGSLRGTLRTLSHQQRSHLHRELSRVARQAAARFGLRHEVTVVEGYPAVVNDTDFTAAVVAAAARSGLVVAGMDQPSMVIEDFSYYLRRWSGAMVYLGAQVGSRRAFNHSDDVLFDEAAMLAGLTLHRLVADLP